MNSSLHRRLARLAQRCEHLAGRMIVVEVHDGRECDDALLDSTLTAAGVAQNDHDLIVKLRRFAPVTGDAPRALLALHPLTHPSARSAL